MGGVLDTVGDAIGDAATFIGKSPIGKFGHYVADAAALATGHPEFIPFIEGGNSAASNYGKTHNFASAAKAGAISGGSAYLGSKIGGSLGANLGTVGGAGAGNSLATAASNGFGSLLGPTAGIAAGNAISNIAGTSIGAAIGGMAGENFGNQYNSSQLPAKKPMVSNGPDPFNPVQANAAAVPGSIAGMSNLTPTQQSTGLANQGTYGGGLGPEENSYFLNLENRKLVNPNGSTNPLSSLQPIENSYLAKLGLGGYGNPTSLLQAISQWKPQ